MVRLASGLCSEGTYSNTGTDGAFFPSLFFSQVSEAEVVDMCNESDQDGSGALNFLEFLELMSRRFGEENPELGPDEVAREHRDLAGALAEFDRDKSGTLSKPEFMAAMMRYGEALTDSQAAEILTNLDIDDGDGMEIDYDHLAHKLASK